MLLHAACPFLRLLLVARRWWLRSKGCGRDDLPRILRTFAVANHLSIPSIDRFEDRERIERSVVRVLPNVCHAGINPPRICLGCSVVGELTDHLTCDEPCDRCRRDKSLRAASEHAGRYNRAIFSRIENDVPVCIGQISDADRASLIRRNERRSLLFRQCRHVVDDFFTFTAIATAGRRAHGFPINATRRRNSKSVLFHAFHECNRCAKFETVCTLAISPK